jgi:hypothetical protein
MQGYELPPSSEMAMIRQEPSDLRIRFYEGYDDLDSLLWGRIDQFFVTLIRHKGNPSPGVLIAFDLGISLFDRADLLPKVLDHLGLCNEDLIWLNPEFMPRAIDIWEKQYEKPHPMRGLSLGKKEEMEI